MLKWLDSIDYRDAFRNPRKAMTIAQLHASLGEAIEQGHGMRHLAIELEYVQGQLCGSYRAEVASVRVDDDTGSKHDPFLVLQPTRTLMHLQKSGFRDFIQGEERNYT